MSTPLRTSDFVTLALKHQLLTADAAAVLSSLVTQRDGSPGEVALEEGMLDAVEVDIVTMLQNPHEAVPGYEILGVLGRGGMGVVFRARQKNLSREVALKTLLLSQLSQREALARFQREAQTIASLQHPNIVSVYDFDKHQGRLYLAMELIQGHDLGHFIVSRKGLDERTAWLIARQIAAGLAFANRVGVVHRDIKPANILVVRDSERLAMAGGAPLVKISDFGLSRLTDEAADARLTQTGRVVGTPNFMAPEQIVGEALDCRTDIYALGCTVYNMLAGQVPFSSQNVSQLMARKLSEAPPDVRSVAQHVSEASAELIAAMMHHEVDKRLGDYDQVLQRIDAVLARLDTAYIVVPASTAPRVRSSQRAPARWLVPTLTGLALLLFGVSAYLAWQRDTQPLPLQLVPGEWSEPLFNGQSAAGWLPDPGSSISPERDFEGGRVLAIDGAATRGFTLPADVSTYRITLAVSPQAANAVSIEFAPATDGKPEYAVMLIDGNAALIHARRERKAVAGSRSIPLRDERRDARYSIRIERHTTHWWTYIDGELIGSVPVATDERNFLRISTLGGKTQIDDVRVEALITPSQQGITATD